MRNLFFLLCLLSVSAYGQGVAVRSIHGTATNLNLKSVGGTNGLTVNTNGLVVTSGNRVGIGELSPDESLEVFGNIITAPTGSVGTVSVPATNMVSRQLTVIGSGPGQVNLTGTNGGISTLEAGSPVDTNNTLRLPKNSVQGVLISTNVAADSKTNQSATVPLAAGQYLTYNGAQYVASNLPSASAFPLTADANAAGFTISNGVFLASLGAAATPSFSFFGDADTGWYRSASDTISLAAAGALQMSFGTAGLIIYQNDALGFSQTTGAADVWIDRTAPGVLDFYNGSVAWQTNRIYGASVTDLLSMGHDQGHNWAFVRSLTNKLTFSVGTNWSFMINNSNAVVINNTIDVTATTTTNINKSAGCVRLAAGQQTYTITNSHATTASIIIPSVSSDDTTLKSVAVIRGAGFFQLKGNAAANADCDLCWLIAAP